jgi:hypothetical protein
VIGDEEWDITEEPRGSCENCGCDLYDDDAYGDLCGQCEWWLRMANCS